MNAFPFRWSNHSFITLIVHLMGHSSYGAVTFTIALWNFTFISIGKIVLHADFAHVQVGHAGKKLSIFNVTTLSYNTFSTLQLKRIDWNWKLNWKDTNSKFELVIITIYTVSNTITHIEPNWVDIKHKVNPHSRVSLCFMLLFFILSNELCNWKQTAFETISIRERKTNFLKKLPVYQVKS